MLNHLKQFSVSNNMFLGPVLDFGPNSSFTVDSFANNPGLCGAPLEPCLTPKQRRKSDFSFKDGFLVGYTVSTVSIMLEILNELYCISC